ncbi:hypothetical protein EST38_g4929 [Candolleomyces aberdarensis]|uniref:Uncharacterized protein n=1 Tax=Candolleomyces aberdarensis TaxID=2316362 RepID=A0A4Q2DNK1_9AGAR|nr:hypothetical protein EST38_g4929 [Candolleomyces aberdarensis]
MFSTLLIHGCGHHSGEPTSFSFNVAPSFPGSSWEQQTTLPAPETWASKDISEAEGCLELSLQNRISEGRIGVTFSALVVSATKGGKDVRPSLPESVCLKFAKQEFCRSLAREAWFYEQLADSCQGTSVPRCYGFFSSTMGEQPGYPDVTFIPWEKRIYRLEDTDDVLSWDNPSPDWLPDDQPGAQKYISDLSGYKSGSPWYTWQRSEHNPTLAVLVLDLLGKTCTGVRAGKVK